MSEYWNLVVDEISDQTGISFTNEQREVAADLISRAVSVHGEYSSHYEPSPAPQKLVAPERKAAWWEDTSELVGSDWVLARQIHHLIASRHG